LRQAFSPNRLALAFSFIHGVFQPNMLAFRGFDGLRRWWRWKSTARPPSAARRYAAAAAADDAAANDPQSTKMIAARTHGIVWAEKAINVFTASELGIAIGEAVRHGGGTLSNKLARAASASLIADKTMIHDGAPGVIRYRLADNARA
jgi:hypothetical protein